MVLLLFLALFAVIFFCFCCWNEFSKLFNPRIYMTQALMQHSKCVFFFFFFFSAWNISQFHILLYCNSLQLLCVRLCLCVCFLRRDPRGLQSVWPRWERVHLEAGAGDGDAFAGLHAKRGGAGGYYPETRHGRWGKTHGWDSPPCSPTEKRKKKNCSSLLQETARWTSRSSSPCWARSWRQRACRISSAAPTLTPSFGRCPLFIHSFSAR